MDKKKILISAITIGATGALLAGATFAFFSDTSTSNNNVFRSGTLDLQVKDDDEGFQNNVTQSFVTPANWAPGETYVNFVCFKNTGNIDIEQILFSLSSPNADNTGVDLDEYVYVSAIELGTSDIGNCSTAGDVGTEGLTPFLTLFNDRFDTNTSGEATLAELLLQIDGTNTVDDDLIDGTEPTPNSMGVLEPNEKIKFRIEWTFDSAAQSDVAGESIRVDMTFTGTQTEGQAP